MKKVYNVVTYDSIEKIHVESRKKSTTKSPKISIIIRCKNEEEKINECLNKIFNQKINEVFEVIIIDSGSTDKTLKIAENYNVNIYSIPSNEFNFGSSIQLGFELSKGEYCVFLSAHCIPFNEKWLKNLMNKFDKTTAAVYGKQTYYDDTFFIEKEALDKTFPNKNRTQKWNKKYKKFNSYKNEITFSNANSCIRKSIVKKIPFRNLIASEDREWAYRAIKEGYKIKYSKDSIVYHAHNEPVEKYYKRMLINSKALYIFANVKINVFHIIPLYLICIFKDLMYLNKIKEFNINNLKLSLNYRWAYTLAHYKGTRI